MWKWNKSKWFRAPIKEHSTIMFWLVSNWRHSVCGRIDLCMSVCIFAQIILQTPFSCLRFFLLLFLISNAETENGRNFKFFPSVLTIIILPSVVASPVMSDVVPRCSSHSKQWGKQWQLWCSHWASREGLLLLWNHFLNKILSYCLAQLKNSIFDINL